ncbi:MAG: hypothetical protein GF400_05130 [Candidatus Eisenbacteria bacterium]|nr:hypothetical protein [Candidatus Eisenbacteria bacterium]
MAPTARPGHTMPGSARSDPVYEVKLDDEMLMSSAVNESEKALARLALEQRGDEPCDVLIGGLGLGYTAAGFRGLSEHLRPGGVLGIWSATEPSHRFLDLLGSVLPNPRSHEISFLNPHVGEADSNWVVVAGGTP